MPTSISEQLVITDNTEDTICVYISDKNRVVISNTHTDAMAFATSISKEDWESLKKFVESNLK